MEDVLLIMLIGYLFGNIQSAFLIGKFVRKVDIRTLGHGNAGASNALMTFGFKTGLLVAIIDILKGMASILLVKSLFIIGLDQAGAPLLYLNGLLVLLGHIFPFYMNFKGGKGTAPLLGVLLGLNPIYGFISGGLLIFVGLTSDYIVKGTLAVTVYFVFLTLFQNLGWIPLIISLVIALMSISLHRENYRRLASGSEPRVSYALKRKN